MVSKKPTKWNLSTFSKVTGIIAADVFATVVSFFTPSQLVAVLLILLGVGLWWLEYHLAKRGGAREEDGNDQA